MPHEGTGLFVRFFSLFLNNDFLIGHMNVFGGGPMLPSRDVLVLHEPVRGVQWLISIYIHIIKTYNHISLFHDSGVNVLVVYSSIHQSFPKDTLAGARPSCLQALCIIMFLIMNLKGAVVLCVFLLESLESWLDVSRQHNGVFTCRCTFRGWPGTFSLITMVGGSTTPWMCLNWRATAHER